MIDRIGRGSRCRSGGRTGRRSGKESSRGTEGLSTGDLGRTRMRVQWIAQGRRRRRMRCRSQMMLVQQSARGNRRRGMSCMRGPSEGIGRQRMIIVNEVRIVTSIGRRRRCTRKILRGVPPRGMVLSKQLLGGIKILRGVPPRGRVLSKQPWGGIKSRCGGNGSSNMMGIGGHSAGMTGE